ncbi:hypothetical protein Tco_0894740 [Tanacetum coccineum]|uniref:Uncharacterized protein n=1 Tax=Tanacetum coccineum TaxID=301880 RepID=A0ABQ5CDU9_9ASTR
MLAIPHLSQVSSMAKIDSKEAQMKSKAGICFGFTSHNKHTSFLLSKEAQAAKNIDTEALPLVAFITGLSLVPSCLALVLDSRVSLVLVHKVARDSKLIVAFDEVHCYILNQDLRAGKILGIDFFDDLPEMLNDDERRRPIHRRHGNPPPHLEFGLLTGKASFIPLRPIDEVLGNDNRRNCMNWARFDEELKKKKGF